jgi:LuxR family transcriptional regulator, maltose regulon positive regulatory protein
VELSAPAGSGKTFLLRSWIREMGLTDNAAWVSVQEEERDAQRFWISVLDALRATAPGSTLVRGLTAAPDLNGRAIVERLLDDLASLEDRVWLVIDDLHELRSGEARHQLELLLMRAPDELRFVLSSRHDLRLGLHRLRLEAELTEIRADDLRFTLDEARALFETAGVKLSESALALLHDRTEGWAAGLRLAALSLAGHSDPERLAAEFSGSERTVAEYLLAEVLDHQPEEVRRLLLRTSVLERVSGPLADALMGSSGGGRILQELEEAAAFVVSLDAQRTWFRYHHLLADLLQLELRRTEPGEVAALHNAAAEWYAEHAYPIEAIRQAQAGEDWSITARLLSDHWFGLYLDGQAATAHELLARVPAGAVAADAELAAVVAADELNLGTLEEAERYLALATQGSASVLAERRERFQIMMAHLRLSLARQRGNLPAVFEEAERLIAPAESARAARVGFGDDLRALALITLGAAEIWADEAELAGRDLERGIALARRIERPYLEILGLAHLAIVGTVRSLALAEECSIQAIELARQHDWSEEPVVAVADLALAVTRIWQGRLDEAEPWLERANCALRAEVEPAAGLMLHMARGLLGRDEEALTALRGAERLTELLLRALSARTQALLLLTLLRQGETERVESALAELGEQDHETGEMRITLAALRLAQDDALGATAALAPVLDGSAPVVNPRVWLTQAFVLEAIARDALGDGVAAERALERALELAEPDGIVWPFLLHPAPQLLERQRGHRTAHAALLSEILDVLDGTKPSRRAEPERLREPLTQSESRVLRYLPTNLSQPEIADELSLSVNTINTHIRHLYTKLAAHRRGEAVERARGLGLLAPSSRRS